ncbi:histidine phosphatase family protein [Rapidithrix thailandica]|uniref:Histidine phosphatase family protein n=1 Tax=Rapidithrix thailandica TaxID=413964 RepID=A0AAW9S914_9BACT
MKILYLLRHAKSSWKDLNLDDFDRPLNKRGKHDAPFMGKKFKEQGILPDLILASPAKRAKKTAKTVAREMGYPESEIHFDKQLYATSATSLIRLLQGQDDEWESIMLVGHNPELTLMSNALSNQYIDNLPTTGLSCIQLNVNSWGHIEPKKGEQVIFDFPKRYL